MGENACPPEQVGSLRPAPRAGQRGGLERAFPTLTSRRRSGAWVLASLQSVSVRDGVESRVPSSS